MRKVLSNFKCPQTNKKCRKDWSQIIIGGQNTWKSLKKESSKYSKDALVSQTGCFYCVPASPGTEWKTPKGREKCTDALYPPTSTSSPRFPFGVSEIHLRDRMAKTSLTFLPPNWKPGDPQERGRRAEGAPNLETATGGQRQPEKSEMGVVGIAHLTTPLPAVELPRQGADPPPTSCGASARVPVPWERSASSVQSRVATTYRPSLGAHSAPATARVSGHRTTPGVPTWLPSTQHEVGDYRDRSQQESGLGPRAPRVAGPPLLIIPQAM